MVSSRVRQLSVRLSGAVAGAAGGWGWMQQDLPSFEGALIMIQLNAIHRALPVHGGDRASSKVPLLDFPPVTVEIAAMRHAPAGGAVPIEIAQKYAHPHRPAADGDADLIRSCYYSKVPLRHRAFAACSGTAAPAL